MDASKKKQDLKKKQLISVMLCLDITHDQSFYSWASDSPHLKQQNTDE